MSSEAHFTMLFEYAPIALMEQDLSAIRARLEHLRSQGVSNLNDYLDAHPEDIEASMASIRLLCANRRALSMYGVQSKEEFLAWRILPGSEQTWEQELVSIEEINRRKQAERALQASEAHLRGLFENAPISLWEEDFSAVSVFFDALRREGVDDLRAYLDEHPKDVIRCMQSIRVLDINRETLRLFGVASKEELMNNLDKVFCVEEQDDSELMRLWRDELVCLWSGDLTYQAEGVRYTLRGKSIYVQMHLAVYPDAEQSLDRVLVSLEDITARRQAENYLRYLGTHDVMTGLYNRAYFQEELKRLGGGRYYPISILIADLDGLKKTNDTFGHEAGDGLIRRASEVLRAGFRQEDVVARIGGDEFAVIMLQTDAEAAADAILRIQTLVRLNNKFYGKPLLSLSLGPAPALNGKIWKRSCDAPMTPCVK